MLTHFPPLCDLLLVSMNSFQELQVLKGSFRGEISGEPRKGIKVQKEVAEDTNPFLCLVRHGVEVVESEECDLKEIDDSRHEPSLRCWHQISQMDFILDARKIL